jgi:alpha-methylacyl-CoA racemase
MTTPLTSLKILDFSTLLPGPFASMLLADMGADVVRVEAPHRADLVRMMPPFDGAISGWHGVLNRNKRSIGLDLKQPEAVEVVKRLVAADGGGYDVVLEQFRPGVMARLGLGYDDLKAVNPGLIYCAITGYGQTGPYKDRAGHDNNYLALSGLMSHSGRQSSGPPPLGAQIADVGGGSLGAVMGILTAVIHRHVTGQGQMVDVSMLDMAIAWQAHVASHFLVGGETPQREGWMLNGGSFYDYYQTADGRYLSVGSLEPQVLAGFLPGHRPPGPDRARSGPVTGQSAGAEGGDTRRDWQTAVGGMDGRVCRTGRLRGTGADHPRNAGASPGAGARTGGGRAQAQRRHAKANRQPAQVFGGRSGI